MNISTDKTEKKIVALFALWLLFGLSVSLFVRTLVEEADKTIVLYSLFLSLCWPFLVFPFIARFRISISLLMNDKRMLFFISIYVTACSLSLFKSPVPLMSLAYLLSTVIGLILSYFFVSTMNEEEIINGLLSYGVVAAGILVIYTVNSGTDTQGRMSGSILSPNSVGMISVSVIMATFLSKRKWLPIALTVPVLWVLLATESRASMLSFAVGMTVWILLKKKKAVSFLEASIYSFIAAILLLLTFYFNHNIIEFFSKLLVLNDPYRGLGTGGTGRLEAYGEAFSIFKSSPWIGIGYRMHEYYMVYHSSAHNGYLSMLADSGVVGSSATLYFIVWSLKNYLFSNRSLFISWALSFISAYLFIGLFERYLLNVGNPMSLIIMALMVRGFVMRPVKIKEAVGEDFEIV
jgi:O-antigen ligase